MNEAVHGGTRVLSPHFQLSEFLPDGYAGPVPAGVLLNLERLAALLELGRTAIAQPIRITSGWRPKAKNERVGGVRGSDHVTGCAADAQVTVDRKLAPAETLALFLFFAQLSTEQVGQVILEDHRAYLKMEGKLWVHVAVPSAEHAARQASNRVLISERPGVYRAPSAGELA